MLLRGLLRNALIRHRNTPRRNAEAQVGQWGKNQSDLPIALEVLRFDSDQGQPVHRSNSNRTGCQRLRPHDPRTCSVTRLRSG